MVKGFFGSHYESKKNILFDPSEAILEIDELYAKIDSEYKKMYDETISPKIPARLELLNSLMHESKELENILYLPYKYRTENYISMLLQMLIEKRADNYKELLALFDTMEYREQSLFKLDNINASIKALTSICFAGFSMLGNQLQNLNTALSSVDSKLTELKSSVIKTNQELKNISLFSHVTMWNTL